MGRVLLWGLGCLLALLTLAVGTVGVRHWQTRGDLESAMTAEQDDAAWLASLPTPDADLSRRTLAWMRASPEADFPSSGATRWLLQGGAPPPDVVERHAADQSWMRELDALLDRDDLCLSSAAWRALGDESVESAFASTLRAARWYGVEAMLADDPSSSLDRLARLVLALDPTCDLSDAFLSSHLSRIRDRTYLGLVLRGKLGPEQVRAWLAERSRIIERVADGFRGERVFRWRRLAGLYESGDHGDVLDELYGSPSLEQLGDYVWHAPRDLALLIRATRALEARLTGKIDAATLAARLSPLESGGKTAQLAYWPDANGILKLAVASDTLAKLVRHLARARLGLSVEPEAAKGPWDLRPVTERHGDQAWVYVPDDAPLPPELESLRDDLGSGQLEVHMALQDDVGSATILLWGLSGAVDTAR